ncbi:MAG: hydrogenase iron-sulfur subunit [Clostridia bacterium]|nr:MAG: hydrogenase iron-sulfur subunit [Clostridia bacterium]
MGTGSEFRPRILGFLCNWCCYGGADLAGVSRFQYPPYIRVIRLMCSGRVDMAFIFRAFSNGIDGVFIGGCHLNDCHYSTHGNYYALSMALLCRKIMGHIGLNAERLRIEWVSAGEGIQFADIMNDFAMRLKELGPLGKGEGIDKNKLQLKLKAVTKLIPYIRVVQNEILRIHFDTVEKYNEFYSSKELDRLFRELIIDKVVISQIMLLLQQGPLSTGQISKILDLTPSEISIHLNNLARQGLVKCEENQKRFALA